MFDDHSIRHPEGAELQFDVSPADWIGPRLLPWGDPKPGFIIPTGYEVYLRVFHHVDESGGTGRVRRRWSEVAQQTGRRMHPSAQFDRFGWPRQPRTGTLDRLEAMSLVAALRGHTTTPEDCWHAIWCGFGQLHGSGGYLVVPRKGWRDWLEAFRPTPPQPPPSDLAAAPMVLLPAREYYLYRGSIDVVPRFEHLPGDLQTPNLWWPQDRAWIVASEIDLDSTFVACTRACSEAILASDLEVLELPPDATLADTINPLGGGR